MTTSSLAAIAILALAVAPARADDDDVLANNVGVRLAAGTMPLGGLATGTYGLGIGVDHHVFEKVHVFAEWEWLWLTREMNDNSGTGQRAHVGLRRALLAKTVRKQLRFFVDGELGGGYALVTDSVTGTRAMAHALAGVRLGYDVRGYRAAFGAELLFRAIAIDHGIGAMFGVGMLWGG